MSQILIVEDEQHIAEGLRFNLEAEGHHARSPCCSASSARSTR